MNGSTITVTFSEMVENHVGMEKLGSVIDKGYSRKDLRRFKKKVGGTIYKLTHENEKAYILIVRNYINSQDPYDELINLDWDKKYYDTRRKKVLNKHARYNLCISDVSREPDYVNKKGRLVSWESLPHLNNIKKDLEKSLNEENLLAECNLYYDTNKCGIGWHGDSERKKVIGLRLGESMSLCYRWYHENKVVSKVCRFTINHGDLYIMSEKATGNDWKKRSQITLRHSAGCDKYTKK